MKPSYLLIFLFLPSLVQAEVIYSSEQAFTVRHEVILENSRPDQVYKALFKDISKWWNSEHTWSGDAANLKIRTKKSAGLWEKLPQRGWVCHLRLIFWQKNKLLRFEGGLGPLQGTAVQGKMDWKIESAEKGASRLVLTYQVWGPPSASLQNLASPVDQVLGGQVRRLKEFVSLGRFKK